MDFSKATGWRKLALLGVVLSALVGGVIGWQVTNDPGSGCFPGRPFTLQAWARIDSGSGMRGVIGPVIGASTDAKVVYAEAGAYGLYLGSGEPLRWQRVSAAPPVLDLAVGKRHEVLYGNTSALYRSPTRGRTWTRLSCDLGITSETGVAVSPSDSADLYLAGQPGDYPLNQLGGYYRSTNGGRTWSRSTVGKTAYDGPEEQAVAVDPGNPNDVTVAPGRGGVFRTKNGDDWAFTRLPGPRYPYPGGQTVWSLAYGAGPNLSLWAGTSSGAFRRGTDGTWAQAGLSHHRVTVYPDARRPSVVLALSGYDGIGRACVSRTTNAGMTWARVQALPCKVEGISVQPNTDAIYAWTRHTIYRSTDQGKTWARLPPLPIR